MQEKADIRRTVLLERGKLTKKELRLKSEAVCNRLKQSDEYKNSTILYIYMDFKNEVITRSIIEDAHKTGKKVAIPKIIGDEMYFYYIKSVSNLQKGYFGILEPETTMPAMDQDGIMIVPGVAFDEKGYRIGYGKGYYDRFLQKHKRFKKIAFAFELQIVEEIPYDGYDVPMDLIITEERVIQIKQ
jgi:5-formyltetrahydrofolate cyclo-ligase